MDDDLASHPDLGQHDAPSVSWEAVRVAAHIRAMPATFVGIAEASGISESTLRNWVTDRVSAPNPRTVEAIARALDVPRRLLVRPYPIPEATHLTFRRASSRQMNEERAMLAAYVRLTASFARFLLGGNWGHARTPDPLVEPGPWQNGQVSAKYFRERLDLALRVPVPNVVELAESLGILVVYGPSMPEGLDACSAVVDGRRIIVVKQNDTDYYRQRWDIAHELGHFVMGHHSAGRENEAAANEFAEGLLFPWTTDNRSRLIAAVRDTEDLDSLLNMQADWKLSVDALLTTAKKQRIRGAQSKVALLAEYRLEDPGGVPRAEQPTTLPNAADEVERQRGRGIEAIAKEDGFPPDVVRLMVARTPPA